MTTDVELECRCGEVRGRVRGASKKNTNRVVCYCDDCQAFLHHLGRAELLDDHGGTRIIQVAPASLSFDRGTERIACLRLTPKGLYRWFTTCCKTPLGNTLTPAIPFVGIEESCFRAPVDEVFGPPIASILGKYAVGDPPPGSTKVDLRLIARTIRLLLGWKIGRRSWPHPFFEKKARKPRFEMIVLTKEEREALRPLCGPIARSIARA